MNQVQMMEKEGYMPAAKAAVAAHVAVTTIYRWIEAEKIEGTKVGDYWYVTTDSLIERLGPVASKAAGLVGDDDAVESTQPQHNG